jgi:hypothetical protein
VAKGQQHVRLPKSGIYIHVIGLQKGKAGLIGSRVLKIIVCIVAAGRNAMMVLSMMIDVPLCLCKESRNRGIIFKNSLLAIYNISSP